MSAGQFFRKGDRVRIARKEAMGVWGSRWVREMDDTIGKLGTVHALHGDLGVHVVPDGDVGGGWYYPVEALALRLPEVNTEPAQPSASYVLSNAELQQAIDRAHAMRRESGAEDAEKFRKYLDKLLAIQLARASKESAA